MNQLDAGAAGLSTGLEGLDQLLRGLMPGDNVVWHVESVDDYRAFLPEYAAAARRLGYRCVYLRFAKHPPLMEASPGDDGVTVHTLDASAGFEAFLGEIHNVVASNGPRTYYVFDCLSDLAADWYSDQMLANFFMLTCPYVYDVGALAYFLLMRQTHAAHTTATIAETAQILLDVYRYERKLYVHPWKVQGRHSPTMHMLHERDGEQLRTVTHSAVIAEILTQNPWLRQDAATFPTGLWDRAFVEGEQVLEESRAGRADADEADAALRRLLRMAVSRDERVLGLAQQYLSLEDVLAIGRRMVGTGLIGGKSVGMLLARAILARSDERWTRLLERHDSFYVGSDVFYTYLVRNGLWWTRAKQRDPATFLENAEQARQRMLTGEFPDYVRQQFEDMLDYFGQSPIIVRSSSLLEDNFGNAFAGKYDSVFCVNQGPRQARLDNFLAAVRAIYASSMSERALRYRAERGLLDRDEQMALLVQRVSGAMYGGQLHYPQVAGVGFSFNPYVWSRQIDPAAGVLRLAFGLGTRAVDRSDDDYTRLVALNAPDRRPEGDFDQIRQYSQRKMDVLDLEANRLVSRRFTDVVARSENLPIDMFATRDQEVARRVGPDDPAALVLTFDNLFARTDFVADMRWMLATLQAAYDYPVDIEFTANLVEGSPGESATDGEYKINMLQCRPLQVREGGAIEAPPDDLPADKCLLEARGAVLGRSRSGAIDRIIYIVPSVYDKLPIPDRYAVARLIGRLTHTEPGGPASGAGDAERTYMLIGPGRWGTTTPSLGVPVQFADISTVSIMCELVAMGENVTPDVSMGTHFFSQLVELDILYFALFPDREGNRLNTDLLEAGANKLTDLAPEAGAWADAVRVLEPDDVTGRPQINANVLDQRVLCYLDA
ncbi:MAG: pyruvate, phosphate dikinase [Phycisphaerae bacterium]|nr:pyruvate, phosphate dikinase [Phycisphaerae bacterium]